MATTKKQYRDQIKFAKQIIKGIEFLIDGGEEFRNLDGAIQAADSLQIVGSNLAYLIQAIQAEESKTSKVVA